MSVRDTPILIYYPGTGTWHPIHILSWCQNVTPDPYSILVPERGTPIHILSWYRDVAPDPYIILVSECDTPILIYYPGTGTWHPIHILSWCRNVTSIHILSWCRNVTPDPHSILVPERGTRSPNLPTFIHQAFFYTKESSLTKWIRVSFQELGFNNFIMLIYS